MDKIQREIVCYLRQEGMGYKAISKKLGLSHNTVKSYCQRHGLGGIAETITLVSCRQCAKPLKKKPGYERKKFCSNACRSVWWNSHPYLICGEAIARRACAHCGAVFESYASKDRKYCGHPCYIEARFGKSSLVAEGR